ncbi:MAG: hypothetical protein ACPGWR_32860, partial [Ardenticatenaceae bacterium]
MMNKVKRVSRRRVLGLGEASCAAVGSASLFSTLLNLGATNSAAGYRASGDGGDEYKALVCLFLAG